MTSRDTLLAFEAREMTPPEPDMWPELPEERPPTFPTALLPEDCAALVEAFAASIPVPVDYAACALLGAASAALVGRVEVQPRMGHREPIQLYQCMGGPSGTSKSSAMKAFMAPLEAWLTEQNKAVRERNREKEHRRELLASQSKKRSLSMEEHIDIRKQVDEIEDEPEFESIQSDTTPEALATYMKRQGGRAIIHTDEGSFINILAGTTYGKQGGQANIDTVLKGWEGGSVNIARVTGECLFLKRADLSITVGMQPGLIARMTGHADLADRGFPQRLLYYLPETITGADLLHLPPYPAAMLKRWSEKLTSLAAVHREQMGLLTLTKGAVHLYDEHRQDLHNRLTGDLGGIEALSAWVRKAHGETARLAGLLALLEDPDTSIVEEAHVRCAVELMNSYFIPHAKRAFGSGSSLSAPARALGEKLRTVEAFNESEMYRSVSGQERYRGKNGRETFGQVLAELSANGYIRRRIAAPSTGRGRPPAPIWEVHPAWHQKKPPLRPVAEGCL